MVRVPLQILGRTSEGQGRQVRQQSRGRLRQPRVARSGSAGSTRRSDIIQSPCMALTAPIHLCVPGHGVINREDEVEHWLIDAAGGGSGGSALWRALPWPVIQPRLFKHAGAVRKGVLHGREVGQHGVQHSRRLRAHGRPLQRLRLI